MISAGDIVFFTVIYRRDLPDSCMYGDQSEGCTSVTLDQCVDASQELSRVCCESCFNLLVRVHMNSYVVLM